MTYVPVSRKNYGCNRTEFNKVSEKMFVLNVQYLRSDMNKTISGVVRSKIILFLENGIVWLYSFTATACTVSSFTSFRLIPFRTNT